MLGAKTLAILQYNVRKERVGTMIPLFEDDKILDYDVIAIQEPWRNPRMHTSLSAHRRGFTLLYNPREDTSVCFYIKDSIDIDS